ncbi:hypothetical protein ACSMEV_15350 [Pseudomonas sp. MLB6B]
MTIYVESLIAVKRELDNESSRVYIEDNALLKLKSLGQYPCARIFNHNIDPDSESEYSGQDIARIVNNILEMGFDPETCLPLCIAEWTDRQINPDLSGCAPERTLALESLVENISLASHIYDKSLSLLHYPVTENTSPIQITGEICAIEPLTEDELPIQFNNALPVFKDFDQFSANVSGFALFEAADTPIKFKTAFHSGALSILKSRGSTATIGWDDFEFGTDFIETLISHQCGPKGRFAGTAYDVICHVIAGISKYELNPFYDDLDKKIQKTSYGQKAWRTHITKRHSALRLMYWSSENSVQLANIGNKHDLTISAYTAD